MKPNPFHLSGYTSPDYFCDREEERGRISNSILSQRNITLISPRRMGKTGLILHSFYDFLGNKDIIPVYFDVLGTTKLKEFTEAFGNALLQSIGKTEGGLKKLLKQLVHLRPEINFNPLNGEPKISLDIRNEKEAVSSLDTIFRLIASKNKYFAIAIDEFQQISEYPEKNIEAILRSQIQQSNNSSFIFSGSKKHMLVDMFSKPSRPFFSSTEMMFLKTIEEKRYRDFILRHFSAARKEITDSAINMIFKVTRRHTFYTQFLCNRLFSLYKKVDLDHVEKMLITILLENEPIFANYLNLITTTQYTTLRAIAIDGEVKSPNSNEFLLRHSLGAASSVNQAINSLIDKEFVMRENGALLLQDKFFREWIRMKTI